MNNPDVIEELLKFSDGAELDNYFTNKVDLLDRPLLDDLASLLDLAGDRQKQARFRWLYDTVLDFFGQRLLQIYLDVEEGQEADFVKEYKVELASDTNFYSFNDLFAKYQDNAAISAVLFRKKSHIFSVVVTGFLLAEGWWKMRPFIKNCYRWLADPAADPYFSYYLGIRPHEKESVAMFRDLAVRAVDTGVQTVLDQMDTALLESHVKGSTGSKKVLYIRQLIPLLKEPEVWAYYWAELGNTLTEMQTLASRQDQSAIIAAYQQALTVFTRDAFPNDHFFVQSSLALAYLKDRVNDIAQNIELAIESYTGLLNLVTLEKQPENWLKLLQNLAIAYSERKKGDIQTNIRTAIKFIEEALTVAMEKGGSEVLGDCQVLLAKLLTDQRSKQIFGYSNRAIVLLESAFAIFTRELFPLKWADTAYNLATLYLELSTDDKTANLRRAIKLLEDAEAVWTKNERPLEWAKLQYTLAKVYLQTVTGDKAADIETAIHLAEAAHQVYESEKYLPGMASALDTLGNAYRFRLRGEQEDNLERAIHFYRAGLSVITIENQPQRYAALQNNLGEAYRVREKDGIAFNINQAAECYNNALKVHTLEAAPNTWAMLQNNLGVLYSEHYEHLEMAVIEQSISHYQNALIVRTRIEEPHEWAQTTVNLALAYDRRISGNAEENNRMSEQLYRTALEIFTFNEYPESYMATNLNLGSHFYQLKDWHQALSAYEKVHNALQYLREASNHVETRRHFSKRFSVLYQRLVTCCLELSNEQTGLQYAGLGKSRTLSENLAADSNYAATPIDDAIYKEIYAQVEMYREELEQTLKEIRQPLHQTDENDVEQNRLRKIKLDERVAHLRKDINKQSDDLIYKYPALSALGNLPAFSISELQQLSANLEATFIEYTQHGEGWGAFVVNPEMVQFVPLDSEVLRKINDPLVDIITGKFWLDAPVAAVQLNLMYDLLIRPLRHLLPDAGALVIAPANGIHLVPFQALVNEHQKYLCEDYAISFVPNLISLCILNEQKKRAGTMNGDTTTIFTVSNAGSGSNYLANVADEIKSIRFHFPLGVDISGNQATRRAVLDSVNANHFDVLHISCHGSFDPEDPNNSGLFLAFNERLTVNDVRVGMRLRSFPLVVLSACQTGHIKPDSGDESIGLSWAFMAAGAGAVVASQWSVNDASTSELFSEFYKIRQQLNVGNAKALQLGIRELRKKAAFRNRPFYWAAFQVMGI